MRLTSQGKQPPIGIFARDFSVPGALLWIPVPANESIAAVANLGHPFGMSDELTIRSDLRVGDLGRITTLHGETYDPLGGYGLRFEAYVGQTVAEFVLGNDGCGKVWLAERGTRLVGCTAIVLRDDNIGQLRWVVVDPAERGQGLGGQLVSNAFDYCKENGCRSVILETTDGLPESQAMYEKLGFEVVSDDSEELWDGPRPLIIMKKPLP